MGGPVKPALDLNAVEHMSSFDQINFEVEALLV